MNISKTHLLTVLIAVTLTVASCGIFDTTEDPAIFRGTNKVKFTVTSTTLFAEKNIDVGRIEVSTFSPADSDIPISFTVLEDSTTTEDSTATAVEGTHYNLSGTSVTIPKDSTRAHIELTLIKKNLGEPKKLYLKISSPDSAIFNNEIEITLEQFTPYNQEDFVGTYTWTSTFSRWESPKTVTIVAGSDPNELVLQDPFGGADYPNGKAASTGSDWTITMSPVKGDFTSSIDVKDAWKEISRGFGLVDVAGSGTFSTTPSDISISLSVVNTVSAGRFSPTPITLTKQ